MTTLRPAPLATSTVSPPRALLTDLTATPIAKTLAQLKRDGRSGDLLVRPAKVAKMVFFDRGRIVFAASNARKDRFGEALVRLGVISPQQFTRASAHMARTRVRFGDALIAAGILDADAVSRAITSWVESIVVSLFDMRTGTAFFEGRRCSIPAEYAVEMPMDRILYSGVASMTSEEMILAGLGDLDRAVLATTSPAFKVAAESAEVLQRAQQPVTIRRLASIPSGRPGLERLRTVYALVACGLLAPPGARHRAAAAPAKPPAPTNTVRHEIDAELARSSALDPKTWLDVSMSAPRGEVVRALEQRMEKYQALRAAAGKDKDNALDTDIELLLGRATSKLRLARREVEATAAKDRPAPPAPAPAPASTPSASMEVEHLLMEADIRMSVSDFVNAARTYAKLVELRPHVVEYHVRYAIALARSPQTVKRAEGAFLEAIRLAPDNAELHFKLAMYYKALKVRSRYVTELRAAVELDPRHKKARAELETLSPKESGLSSLKKLLG
jgi:tetratricopeptide (TPR) repeat protein